MINQVSSIGFGSDISVMEGYVQAANERLGNFDLIIENRGANTLTILLKECGLSAGGTGPYTPLGGYYTVVAGGIKSINLSVLSQRIGFFGSGNTTANFSTVIKNAADLRGAQIDIVATGRRGYGFDTANDTKAGRPKWGTVDGESSTTENQ